MVFPGPAGGRRSVDFLREFLGQIKLPKPAWAGGRAPARGASHRRALEPLHAMESGALRTCSGTVRWRGCCGWATVATCTAVPRIRERGAPVGNAQRKNRPWSMGLTSLPFSPAHPVHAGAEELVLAVGVRIRISRRWGQLGLRHALPFIPVEGAHRSIGFPLAGRAGAGCQERNG